VNLKFVVILSLWFISFTSAAIFKNPGIQTSYSKLILEKNARNDSLLPKLNGDKALKALLESNPDFWLLESMDQGYKLATKLNVNLVYIDGIREDQFCDIQETDSSSALEWKLKIGLDFNSGASNTVADHVRGCLNLAREKLGVAVERAGKVVVLAPKDPSKEGEQYHINAQLDSTLKSEVARIHEDIQLKGECPKNMKAYVLLLKLYDQVKATKVDLLQLNQELNKANNGNKEIQSCSFSREWNRLYSDKFELSCNPDKETCHTVLERSGSRDSRNWFQNEDGSTLIYDGRRILGLIGIGEQSVRRGGVVLDLRFIPLTKDLYLQAYLDESGKAISLGFLAMDGSLKAEELDKTITESK
jgi:hypothetical protein